MLRRAQVSIEFILIFLFVFVLLSIATYVIGFFSVEVVDAQVKAEVDDFAKSIESEIALLQKVEGGFNRSVEVPQFLIERYNLTLQGDFLILTPLDAQLESEPEPFFYALPSNQTYYLLEEDRDLDFEDETYLVLTRENTASTRVLS